MAYVANLDAHRKLTIVNSGEQTQVNLTTSSPGQQQSQSSNFVTGSWLAKPKLFQVGQGFVVKFNSQQGDNCVLIQANCISGLNTPVDLQSHTQVELQEVVEASSANFQPMAPIPSMKPMSSMKPMQPLTMGNMSMDINSMTMQMGNMSMGFEQPSQTATRFCAQCGQEAKAKDRFCRSCGHNLHD